MSQDQVPSDPVADLLSQVEADLAGIKQALAQPHIPSAIASAAPIEPPSTRPAMRVIDPMAPKLGEAGPAPARLRLLPGNSRRAVSLSARLQGSLAAE